MRKLIYVLVLCFLLPATTTLAAQKDLPLKIGVLNLSKVMEQSKAAKEAREIFQKEKEKKIALLENKSKKVNQAKEKLKEAEEDKKNITQAREELAREVKEYNRLKSDIEEELKKKDLELTQKILNEIMKVVDSYAKSEGFSLILDRRNAFFANETIDITDRIIKAYDATTK